MGAPGYTIFCRNGHIAKSVLHHYIDDTEVHRCPDCDSCTFFTHYEWGDDDYEQFVSVKPIRTVEKRGTIIWDDGTSEPTVRQIHIYAVNHLKGWKVGPVS